MNLYVSSDGGKVFKKARLPFQLTEHSYTILDTSEGSVFLHVNHGDYNTGKRPPPCGCPEPRPEPQTWQDDRRWPSNSEPQNRLQLRRDRAWSCHFSTPV